MTPTTHQLTDRAALLDAIVSFGLLTPAQKAKAAAAVPTTATSVSQTAQCLVLAGFLTRFQADRILAGRTDGYVLGQYVILEQVGRGAMGRVYKARHRTMNRSVAIKVLNPELTRTALARHSFQREVRAAAQLNHPNIVTAYDANEISDRSYLVLEFVDGPTLDALVRQHGPLPVSHACEFVRQTALGLQHAHEMGMIHRDIKPANILVARPSKNSSGSIVKIADFGIARLTPQFSPSTQTPFPAEKGLVGTPDFLAPEQAHDSQSADPRSDLYSLGCVLYFLLTGQPPFLGGSAADKVRRHQWEEPIRIDRLRPDVPPAVAEIVHKLLAKDPAARFVSAAELVYVLQGPAAALGSLSSDGTAVSFDLPAAHSGPHSFATSNLTGISAAPTLLAHASETSPWAQITAESAMDTLPHELGMTPVEALPTRREKPTASAAKPRGISTVTIVTLCTTLVISCLFAIGFFIKHLSK